MRFPTLALFFFVCFFSLSVTGQEASSLVEQGHQASQRGKYDEALNLYNQAIELDATLQDAYIKRAFVYSLLKDYEKAIADYTKIIELNPNFVLAYLSRGSAFNKLQAFEKAMSDFDKVISLDPENSEAYNNRGWSKKGLGDQEGACSDWKTSKKMGNEEAKIILKNNRC